jgi:hypothetical protein
VFIVLGLYRSPPKSAALILVLPATVAHVANLALQFFLTAWEGIGPTR